MKKYKHSDDMKHALKNFAAKRPIIGTFEDGTEVQYESITDACRWNHHGKKSRANVYRVLRGERNTHHGVSYRYDGDGTPQKSEVSGSKHRND